MYRFLMFSHLHLPKDTYFSSLPFSFDPFQVINSINNLREKFSPGPGIEPGSPALRTGAITTKPPRRSAGPS